MGMQAVNLSLVPCNLGNGCQLHITTASPALRTAQSEMLIGSLLHFCYFAGIRADTTAFSSAHRLTVGHWVFAEDVLFNSPHTRRHT